MPTADLMQVSRNFPNIDDIRPLSSQDQELMDEVREVIKKYDALDHFGLCLLHSHFEVHDDEIMVEECDLETRTLTSRPVKKCEIQGNVVETMWSMTITRPTIVCKQICQSTENPGGNKTHDKKHVSSTA